MKMKQLSFTLTSLAMLAMVGVTTTRVALAQNSHFLGTLTAAPGSDGDDTNAADPKGSDVAVSFKEAGLGNNVSITYVADANFTGTYACINGGGKHPSATNKETVSGPVSGTGTFSSGKNGTISQSVNIEEAGPGSFACPSGQSLILAFVSYTGITLTDTTTPVGPVAATPGSLSACFVSGDLAAELCP